MSHCFHNKLTCGSVAEQFLTELTLEIPPYGWHGLLRETIKVEKTSRRGNARVCLLGTACWELHLLLFSGVSLLPAAGDALESASGPLVEWLLRKQPRLFVRLGWLCVLFSSPWITATAGLELAESSSFTVPLFLVRLKLEELTIWLKLRQDFPNFLRKKNTTPNGRGE